MYYNFLVVKEKRMKEGAFAVKFKRLPDSELEVMLIIWDGERLVSTSDIMQRIKEKKSVQLIQNSLNRLESKGYLKCEKIGRLNHYTPLIPLSEYRSQETASFLEKFYQNSGGKLFATLIENSSLSTADIETIKILLEKSGD